MRLESIDKLTELIRNSDNIVFFGGAGVSTESGIPDFRSETGIYNAKKVYGRSPEELVSHSFFMAHPEEFYNYYRKSLVFADIEPNDAHKALAKLEEMGKLRAVVTQNIDNLHQKAGSKNVLELHGNTFHNYCMKCGKTYDVHYVLNAPGVPRCEVCGGMVRPDVVLYEESLNEDVLESALHFISHADMLIIGGTSLVVYPAAGLIRYYRGNRLVLMNRQETPYDSHADLIIREPIGRAFRAVMDALK